MVNDKGMQHFPMKFVKNIGDQRVRISGRQQHCNIVWFSFVICYYYIVLHVFIIFQRTLYIRKAGNRSVATTDVRAYVYNSQDFSILHITALGNWIVTCRDDGIISHFLAAFRTWRWDAKLRWHCGLAYANMKFFLSKTWRRNKDKPSRILNLIYMKLSEKLYAPLALSLAQETRKHFTWLKRGPEGT